MHVLNRARPYSVALETTLLVHGVPRRDAAGIAAKLAAAVRAGGGEPAVVGVVSGRPIVGLTEAELALLLDAERVEKVNAANLGLVLHRGSHGATTISATIELAARAGVRLMATGGLGGVHRGYDRRPDISSDLTALARHPVAVVASGVKSLLDVYATREVLETLGVPVIGFRTDSFPAFYVRETDIQLDGRFDEPDDLGAFLRAELARTGRAVVVANPCPEHAAIPSDDWAELLTEAEARVGIASGRAVTPALLAQIHELSRGASLAANLALAESNALLAGRLARAVAGG
ncbi:MAG TPA: pseudouridine-5'-phosphate glycosidase [Phycisphaerales bacterium]|nr:pseudouridine-5'-phosphate glycosidase [Phycisphaerales bacterium]